VMGSTLVEKVKELIHEGNIQRIIIKNEQGYTLVEIPYSSHEHQGGGRAERSG
jgi:hypothetical protein